MMKVNASLLPIKAHFFLYWGYVAAMLPFMMVVARQLGVPVGVQGAVWAVTLTVSVVLKPVIAALADSLPKLRKTIFLGLMVGMVATTTPIGFLDPLYPPPQLQGSMVTTPEQAYLITSPSADDCLVTSAWDCHISCATPQSCPPKSHTSNLKLTLAKPHEPPDKTQTHLKDPGGGKERENLNREPIGRVETATPVSKLTNSAVFQDIKNTQQTRKLILDSEIQEGKLAPNDTNFRSQNGLDKERARYKNRKSEQNFKITTKEPLTYVVEGWDLQNETSEQFNASVGCAGGTRVTGVGGCGRVVGVGGFWVYVVLLLLGQVAASTVESASDAICCDTLGEGGDYGRQRVWGAGSYGLLGLLSGLLVDLSSGTATHKDYRPAFILSAVCGLLDLVLAVLCLKVPRVEGGEEVGVWRNLRPLLRLHRVLVFLVIAFLVGFFDGLDTTYVFVLQEDMAAASGTVQHLKLLQGVTLLVQALSSIPCMLVCDSLLKKLGSERVITLVLFLYTIRLLGLSVASGVGTVWATVAIEVVNGPCFGLGFTAVVVHASSITPQGTSTTVQSVVGVCYSTLGYAGASLIGGVVYEGVGGTWLYLITGLAAALTCLAHLAYLTFTRDKPGTGRKDELELEVGEISKETTREELEPLNVQASPKSENGSNNEAEGEGDRV